MERDNSVSAGFALQAWRPQFDVQNLYEKLDRAFRDCFSSAGEAETGMDLRGPATLS